MDQAKLKKVMSDLAKLSHKKKPRPKSFYVKMAKARWDKKKAGDKSLT